MTFDIQRIPDRVSGNPWRLGNYIFALHDAATGRTALVDAPPEGPIVEALEARGWGLDELWLTHHHDDHIEGVDALRARYGCEVIGNAADAARLPRLDREVRPGDVTEFLGARCEVLDVSGHTIGHVAYHLPERRMLFSADSLMALGCGRLFEGTPEMMWNSLRPLRDLDPDTVVYSGHEYTRTNAEFALSVDPDNADLQARAAEVDRLIAADTPTVPTLLSTELATNPFLRVDDAGMRTSLGMQDASDVEVFAEIRGRRDGW